MYTLTLYQNREVPFATYYCLLALLVFLLSLLLFFYPLPLTIKTIGEVVIEQEETMILCTVSEQQLMQLQKRRLYLYQNLQSYQLKDVRKISLVEKGPRDIQIAITTHLQKEDQVSHNLLSLEFLIDKKTIWQLILEKMKGWFLSKH